MIIFTISDFPDGFVPHNVSNQNQGQRQIAPGRCVRTLFFSRGAETIREHLRASQQPEDLKSLIRDKEKKKKNPVSFVTFKSLHICDIL